MSQLKTNNSKLSKVNLSDLTIIQQLPENQRKAILELIDTKTNNDMKEVIRAVEALGIRFDEIKMSTALQLSQMKDSIDLRFSQMQASTDASLSQMKESTDIQLSQVKESIRILYWVLGIVGSGVVAGITIYLATLR